jgi:prepilin-type N-terminal cleavage/methylation domain-containing protein
MRKINIRNNKGFTLVEVMVAVAMLGIITMIALPRLNLFLARMQVDNEVSTLHRLLLTARNVAISESTNVTLCPLVANNCVNNWQNQLTVFIDLNNNQILDAGERVVKVKEAITNNDRLVFDRADVRYAPTGLLNITGGPFSFRYCPQEYPEFSRGIMVNNSGRVTTSHDIDDDGIDEFPATGADVTCP